MKELGVAICRHCGKEFIKIRFNQVFCVKQCGVDYDLIQRERKERARYVILERDEFRCIYCGSSPIENNKTVLVLDHIIPYWYCKDNSIYNLVTACLDCNSSKGPKFLSEDVYRRIVTRNIKLNKIISAEKEEFVNKVLTYVFECQKMRKKKH
jgi:CRISPR/Cas system Type II protein with McrA/HNH and RuvC-like nuclease domain